MLWLGTVLVLSAGVQLYLFPTRTDDFFAWTIDPPITAAFLGGFYLTSVFLAGISAVQRHWVNARVGLLGVQVFVWVTLFATLLHLDKFHLDGVDDLARGAAWLWLVVYIVDPPLLTYFYLRQIRTPGQDPPRRQVPPAPVRAVLVVHSAIAIVTGLALFLAPEQASKLWPWSLTPLTARAIAAWLLGLGIVQASAVWENEWLRLRPALGSYLVLGVFQIIALFRFRDDLEAGPRLWIYIGFLLTVAAVGLYGLIASTSRSVPTDEVEVTQRSPG